mmetsp:Transcript_42650/g.166468  ORF Transcript_42650/g.166468 Transcript_42650/m.166468 type:complete len:261 (+) Transcript_42650:2330-3112(+)
MNGFLLHRLNLQGIELLIQHLAKIHDNGFMNFLPKMRSENLNQRDLQRWDLSVHENAGEIELHLETNVDVSPVNGRTPPKSETPVGDLVEARSLGVGQFLIFHAFFESGRLLPEQSLPSGEVGTLKQGVLEYALYAPKSLDHIRSVIVQVPQLAVMPLMSPPEGIISRLGVLLEVQPHSPSLVIRQSVSILLEQRVDSRNSTIPTIFQILKRQTTILGHSFLSLERIFGPHSLGVHKLTFPRLNVAVQVRNQLVLVVAQA